MQIKFKGFLTGFDAKPWVTDKGENKVSYKAYFLDDKSILTLKMTEEVYKVVSALQTKAEYTVTADLRCDGKEAKIFLTEIK